MPELTDRITGTPITRADLERDLALCEQRIRPLEARARGVGLTAWQDMFLGVLRRRRQEIAELLAREEAT